MFSRALYNVSPSVTNAFLKFYLNCKPITTILGYLKIKLHAAKSVKA